MMKIFKNIEEMKPYYNEKTNTYEFIENGCPIDIVIDFELDINSNIRAWDIKACEDIDAIDINAKDISACDIKACDIKAGDIKAWDINARNINAGNIKACEDIDAIDINAWDINARDIKAKDIKALDIKAGDIKAKDIKALDIKAGDIKAKDIKAWDIKALDIQAEDIRAENINANNILYSSVCYARQKFVCNSIKGERPNSKYFCLDSEIIVNDTKYMVNIYELPDLRETVHVLRNQIENPSISTGLDINEATELESILTAVLSINQPFNRNELLEHFLKCHVKVTAYTMKFIEFCIKHGYFQPVKEEKKEKKNAKRCRKQNR